MKILITGGLGFIGSHLVDLLLEEKHKIIILTKSYSKKQNVSHKLKKIKIEKVDITNFKKLSESIEKQHARCHNSSCWNNFSFGIL